MPAKRRSSRRACVFVGIGLDAKDGEKRLTKGRDFLLVGGSEGTHELMTEHAIRLNEELDRRGKRLADVRTRAELVEILRRACN